MTQAIEELEKLVEDLLHRIENGHTQSIGAIHNVRMVQYGVEEVPRYRECLHAILPRLRAEVRERPVGAGRTEAEVRERERAAYEQGFKDCERGMTLAIETERRYPNA